MPKRKVHGGTTARSQRRRRVAAGGLALGVSSLLAVGGIGSPADAQTPTAVSECTGSPDSPTLAARVSDFAPNSTLTWYAAVRQPNGSTSVFQNIFPLTTDSTGAGRVGSVTLAGLPLQVAFAVYNDTNGNGRYDGTDDRIYFGHGTVTDCPQDVTLAPK